MYEPSISSVSHSATIKTGAVKRGQEAWIEDESRFKIGMVLRQTGKTFSTGGECVDECFRAWAEDRRTRWVELSRSERQASEMRIEVIEPFTKAFYAAYNTLVRGGEPRFEEAEFRAPQEKGPEPSTRR